MHVRESFSARGIKVPHAALLLPTLQAHLYVAQTKAEAAGERGGT